MNIKAPQLGTSIAFYTNNVKLKLSVKIISMKIFAEALLLDYI